MPITNKIINNVICFTCLIKQDLEIEMDEAISKLLSDDVIVSGDEIEKDDVENEYDEPNNKKKKKRKSSQHLNVGDFIQGLVWVRKERRR